ncbi:unnamed protein product [Rotaria sp. Silwood1]|nr:unnamed protein product [Rotaria sp. Silwood1]CAF0958753.1 unnamed protein product [Rotaria sp. Silwood1]CAF4779346.1 unnamed protein product [Rotaria sp. Silwood1]CAF4980238.1 unnamed protein product [Rotaria sp. Silwood1]
MVVHRQYHSKKDPNSSSTRLLHLTIPVTSNFLYSTNDFVWNNPMELDLLNMKKAPSLTSTDENHFLNVLPCMRRLYTIFNSICPNLYRIHCSDSLRILQEIICLIDEYLHIHLPSNIPINELLYNEEYFDDFIHKLRFSPFNYVYPNNYSSSKKPEIHCFGQGIHACNDNNKLNQTTLFCFELTSSLENNFCLPIDIVILDPNENIVSNDVKYINTYDQGYTKLFSCCYKPITQAGIYKISFLYNHIQLTTDPFTVFIKNPDQLKEQSLSEDAKEMNVQEIPQYELEGDGCSTKVILNSIARFRLRINSSTNSHHQSTVDPFSLSIIDPFGHTIVVQRRILSSDLLELTYQPMSIGEHKLTISYNNKIHRQLIIDVIHDEINYLSKLKPFGPGLQRAIVGIPTEFYVDLSQQKLINPTINTNHIQFCLEPSYHAEIDYEQHMATVRYTPLIEGKCPIHILEHNKDIQHSPFIANIKKENILHNKPSIHITGLSQNIIVHRPVEFEVSIDNPFDDSTYTLHIEILTDENSPSVSIDRHDPSSYKCSFIPNTLGRYIISIDYAGIVPENNPFYCEATQEKDIQLTGPAVNNQCLTLNEPTHFYFKLEDLLMKNSNETNSTYESGYSSNDDTSLNSSITDGTKEINDEHNNYRVTITDGHGNKKSNVSIKNLKENMNDNVRVDFTPDEQILFINISCTW